ncbi:N-acetylmuramoyl-L-alanine amidase [Brevibacillus antibioticus]|uniref:N-acetylmuramoyl-L-alanine amidase n=1 Tax=Brevibacillus antibioticus TaxID=2570228 RepID=A0A4U2YC25_9BACL|nr:N-acetylmuramoyl-L-alanine amidase [Brevibacillus antibioticus]
MSLDGLKFLVDPGHGGSDVGAIGTLNGEDVYEKDLALLFAQAVAETLEDFGATVYLTRHDDSKVSIDDRWKPFSRQRLCANHSARSGQFPWHTRQGRT